MSDVTKRIVLRPDNSGEIPDDEGHVPVVFLPFSRYPYGFLRIVIGSQFLPDEHRIRDASSALGWERTERWLNIICRGRAWRLEEQDDRGGYYIAVPTDAWVETMTGGPQNKVDADEWMAEYVYRKRTELDELLSGNVYGLVPEVLQGWVPFESSGSDDIADEVQWDGAEYRWEEPGDPGSLWGVYGKEWALEEARSNRLVDWTEYDIVDTDGSLIEEVRRG